MIPKDLLYSIFFLFCSSPLLFGQSSGDQIFDNSKIHEIRFEFNQSNYWQQLISNYENNSDPFDDKPYLLGSVRIDDVLVDSIGVRFKGFTSYAASGLKKPIKIDFNEFVPGKRFDGLRKLNLNNGTGDPGLQRDVICYDLHNANGVKASRTSFARVYFNGMYWGLYQVVEQVDKEFLQRNFDDDDGNLFKNKAWSQFEDFGDNINSYKEIYELKTNRENDDWSGFIHLMDVINNSSDAEFPEEIKKVFNVDQFLKTLVVDVATNNWDSYLEHGRNWYMYEDLSTGIFNWIPWDYNFALGGGNFGGGDEEDCFLFPYFAPFVKDGLKVNYYDFSFGTQEFDSLWDFGDGNISTERNPSHQYLTGGPYNVCLTLSIGEDCVEEFCLTVDVSNSHDNCFVFSDADFEHEDENVLAILFSFLPTCCNSWGDVCEEEYSNFSSTDNGFSFEIDQRQNEGILINRLLNVPEFYNRYLRFFCTFLEDHFSYSKYNNLINQNRALIEDHVLEDPNYLFSFEKFESDLGIDGIKGILSERIGVLAIEINEIYPSCKTMTSANDLNADLPFKIFPNPANDHIRIQFGNKTSEVFRLNVYSATGQLMFQDSAFDPSSDRILTSQYGKGFYFLELRNKEGNRYIAKFIKG